MKRAVFYLEPTIQDGIEGYIVRDWKNVLKIDKLPKKYFEGFPHFADYYGVVAVYSEFFMPIYITKGEFFRKQSTKDCYNWNAVYSLMQQAGHRFSQILKEQRKPKIVIVKFEI